MVVGVVVRVGMVVSVGVVVSVVMGVAWVWAWCHGRERGLACRVLDARNWLLMPNYSIFQRKLVG